MPYLIYPPDHPKPSSPIFHNRKPHSPVYAVSRPDTVNDLVVKDLRSWGWRVIEHAPTDVAWQSTLQKYSVGVDDMGVRTLGREGGAEDNSEESTPSLWQTWGTEGMERIKKIGADAESNGDGESVSEGKGRKARARGGKLIKRNRELHSSTLKISYPIDMRRVGGLANVENCVPEECVRPWIRQELPYRQDHHGLHIHRVPALADQPELERTNGILVTHTFTVLVEQNISLTVSIDFSTRHAIWPIREPPVEGQFREGMEQCGETEWTYVVTCSGVCEPEKVLTSTRLARLGWEVVEVAKSVVVAGGGFSKGRILPGCTLAEVESVKFELLR